MPIDVHHYLWAGLDFLVDRDDRPVLIEANRSSHMLGEYLQLIGDERPFELTAEIMNCAGGPACLFWRRGDPFPNADEDASFIGNHLAKYLAEPPVVCNVEDNQGPRAELVARDGRRVRPGSIFRWWYGLPWSYERSGVTVINPNSVWLVVRDKLNCTDTLAHAKAFRVPRSFAVESPAEAGELLAANRDVFRDGYVIRPRVGWGGHGVQIGEPAVEPLPFAGSAVLSERIIPRPRRDDGRFWEARAFVMAGVYLGAIRHSNRTPHTNYWQGAEPERLDEATTGLLEPAALEAVALLDAAAARIHALPEPPHSPLTEVVYEGIGMPNVEGSV